MLIPVFTRELLLAVRRPADALSGLLALTWKQSYFVSFSTHLTKRS